MEKRFLGRNTAALSSSSSSSSSATGSTGAGVAPGEEVGEDDSHVEVPRTLQPLLGPRLSLRPALMA